MSHIDRAVYVEHDTALLIEPSGRSHIAIIAQGSRDALTGRTPHVSAVLTLRDAVKARTALTRQIRLLRKSAVS